MPENLLHPGSYLDISGQIVSYSPVLSACESNIHSTQHGEILLKAAMEKIYMTNHVSRGKNNTPFLERQKKSSFQFLLDKFIGSGIERMTTYYISKMNNSLSVTIMNDELLSNKSDFLDNSLMRKQIITDNESTSFQPFVMEKVKKLHYTNTSHPENKIWSFDNIHHSDMIEKDDKEIILNLMDETVDRYVTQKDNNIIKSHSMSHKMRKLNDTIDNTLKTEGIDEDASMNVESFDMISHSDEPRSTDEENSISRLSNICLNAWKNLSKQFFYGLKSVGLDLPGNNPRYLTKQHHPKKMNAVATGRGKAKCQLRRSGVSQTRHRYKTQERIRYIDMEVQEYWQDYSIQNHFLQKSTSLDDTFDYDVSDTEDRSSCDKQEDLLLQENFEDDSSVVSEDKNESFKECEKYEVKKSRCHVVNSSLLINCSNKKNENSWPNNNSKRMQGKQSSKISTDLEEDSFIIFKDSDDKSSICNHELTEDQIEIPHISESGMEINDEDNNSKIYETPRDSSPLWLLSESSVDSEDSFIIFKESDEESSIHNHQVSEQQTESQCTSDFGTEIDDEYSEMQEDSSRSRLLSENSVDSEDSFIIFKDNNEELSVCNDKMRYSVKKHCVPETKVNYEDCNTKMCETKRDSFRLRLPSESSEDSFIIFDEGNDESLKTREKEKIAEYRIGMPYVSRPSMRIDNYSNKNYKISNIQRNSIQPQSMSDGCNNSDRSTCLVSNPQLAENCAINSINCEKTSSYNINNLLEDKSINRNKNGDELTTNTRKVRFNLAPVVHVMVTWDYAYRTARIGPWETMARDNERFKGRIKTAAIALDPILTSQHRSQVWQERFAYQE